LERECVVMGEIGEVQREKPSGCGCGCGCMGRSCVRVVAVSPGRDGGEALGHSATRGLRSKVSRCRAGLRWGGTRRRHEERGNGAEGRGGGGGRRRRTQGYEREAASHNKPCG
jgi:hypothetical protein